MSKEEPSFKRWSETSSEAKETMRPTLEIRSWSELDETEKVKIIKHLHNYGWLKENEEYVKCIIILNDDFKLNTYGIEFFKHGGPHRDYMGNFEKCCIQEASTDFFTLLRRGESHVAIELLSLYAKHLIQIKKAENSKKNVTDYVQFDRFSNAINEIFDHFAVNMRLTRQGFVPKQEELIHEEIVKPTLLSLSGENWAPVNNELSDALDAYNKGTAKGYSNAITHLASALQAFLQLKINGSTGKGDIDDLLRKGMNNGILPNDELSKKVLNGLKSTVMEYRQKQGIAHPKNEYGNEQSARLILNTVLVFIQHCNN